MDYIKKFEFGKFLKQFDEENHFFMWYNAQPITARVGFYGAAVIALLTHAVMYSTLILERHLPGFAKFRDFSEDPRWFGNWINRFSFYYMNWFTGLMQVFFLSLSAFIIIKAFNIKNKLYALLIAGLVVTFPAIAETNMHFMSAASMSFAVFLSILGFYVTKLYRFGWIIGSFLLMLGLAIYQSKISVAMVASIICLIIFVVENNPKFADFAKYASRYFLLIALGLVAYAVSLEVFNITSDYAGFDRVLSIDTLLYLPINILRVIFEVGVYFFADFRFFIPTLPDMPYVATFRIPNIYLILSYMFVFFMGMLSLVLTAKIIRNNVPNIIIVCILVLLLPITANFSRLFGDAALTLGIGVPGVLRMTSYAFIFFLILPLILWENIKINTFGLRKAVCIALVFIIGYYVSFSNFIYLRGEVITTRYLHFTNRVAAQVEPLLPYSTNNEVYLIGNVVVNPLHPHIDDFTEHIPRAHPIDNRLWRPNTVSSVIRYRIGLSINHVHDYDRRQYLHYRAIAYGMPVWPLEGSVALIDGVVVGMLDFFGRVDVEEISPSNFSATANHTGKASDLEFEYTWYLYKDGQRIEQIYVDVYDSGYLEFEIYESGSYQLRVFVRLQDGQDLVDGFSQVLVVE